MLEVRELDVSYGDAHTLWGVDLDLGEGEIVSVVGSNGAGKTTLVNAVAGLVPIRGGRVVLNGRDLARLASHQVGEHGIAIVPEGRRLFPEMTVEENLDLGAYRRSLRRSRDETVAWVHSLFPVLRDRLRQRAGTMSGGEQQMLAIGRALMARPRVLLLDEPSLGLAPVIVDRIFDVITEINRQGVAVLLVEQNVTRALDISNRAYLLVEGRVELTGTAEELKADDTVAQACLGISP